VLADRPFRKSRGRFLGDWSAAGTHTDLVKASPSLLLPATRHFEPVQFLLDASAAIQELASRVQLDTAPELERYFPDRWPARVEIRWKGKELSRERLAPAGDVESGYSWDEALEKFRRALSPQMPEERIEALSRGLRELDRARSWPFPELREALTGAAATGDAAPG